MSTEKDLLDKVESGIVFLEENSTDPQVIVAAKQTLDDYQELYARIDKNATDAKKLKEEVLCLNMERDNK